MADPDWLDELASVMETGRAADAEGRFDLGEWVAEPKPPAPAVVPDAIEARLVRIETLLGADLEKLGPAILADSVAGLQQELQALEARLAQLDATPPAPVVIETPSAPVTTTVFEPDLELRAQVGELTELIGRFDERLTAQAQFLAALSAPTAPPTPDPGLGELEAKVDALVARVDEPLPPDPEVLRLNELLTERFARVEALLSAIEPPPPPPAPPSPEPALARLAELLDRRFARIEVQLEAQLEALDEVHQAALEPPPPPPPPPAPELPVPVIDTTGVEEAIAELGPVLERIGASVDSVPDRVAVEAEVLARRVSSDDQRALADELLEAVRAELRAYGTELAGALAASVSAPAPATDGDEGGDADEAGLRPVAATPADLQVLAGTMSAELERLRRDLPARRTDVELELLEKSIIGLGRRILSLEQLNATALAVDERTELRLRELVDRLDELTTRLTPEA